MHVWKEKPTKRKSERKDNRNVFSMHSYSGTSDIRCEPKHSSYILSAAITNQRPSMNWGQEEVDEIYFGGVRKGKRWRGFAV